VQVSLDYCNLYIWPLGTSWSTIYSAHECGLYQTQVLVEIQSILHEVGTKKLRMLIITGCSLVLQLGSKFLWCGKKNVQGVYNYSFNLFCWGKLYCSQLIFLFLYKIGCQLLCRNYSQKCESNAKKNWQSHNFIRSFIMTANSSVVNTTWHFQFLMTSLCFQL